jgi:O-acetylhomoserine (thiol)-lyase
MSYAAYNDPSLGFTTKQLHAGYNPAEHYLSKAVPIYQTSAFELGDFDRCIRLFSYAEEGHSYVRFSNPTNDVLEKRIAALEGGAAGLSLSSGMAAISNIFLNLARAGDEIIATNTLYGGSVKLLRHILPQYGITARFVEDENDLAAYEKLINKNTKAIFFESLGNPRMNIVDIEQVVALAHCHGIPVIVDNTFATPYLFRPFDWGADIVCYSATKYLGGHGTTIGGLVVEKGGFDWFNGRFPQIREFYDEWKGSINHDDLYKTLFTRRLRMVFLTDMGAHLSPISAFLLLQGIETLSLRMRQHTENTLAIATFLEAHPAVREVSYPALPSSPYYALSQKYFIKGPGAILSVRLKGGFDAAMNALKTARIFDYMVNVGDAKSLIVHPVTSTHYGLSEQEQEAAGIYGDMLRLSIGIEDIADLINDLQQALDATI